MRNQYNLQSDYRWSKNLTLPMVLFDIAILWYYCLGGSILLRPFASAFWIIMSVVGLFVFRFEKFPINRYTMLVGASVLYMLLTSAISVSPSASLKYALSLLVYLLIAIELTSCYKNILFFLKGLLWFSVFLFIVSIIEKVQPGIYLSVFSPLLPAEYHNDVLIFMRNGSINGFANQTSSNAIAMSLGLGVSIFYIITKKQSYLFMRVVSIITAVAFTYGIILTNRRGTLVVAAAVIVFLLYTKRGGWFTKILVLVSTLNVVFFVGISNIPVLQSIVNKNQTYIITGDVTNGRLGIWAYSMSLFKQHPFFGSGADSFQALTNDLANAHNSYIQALVELGVIGAVLFFAPFVYGLIKTLKVNKQTKGMSLEQSALIITSLFWQLYSFGQALFEGLFSSEITVFMLFFFQSIVFQVANHQEE